MNPIKAFKLNHSGTKICVQVPINTLRYVAGGVKEFLFERSKTKKLDNKPLTVELTKEEIKDILELTEFEYEEAAYMHNRRAMQAMVNLFTKIRPFDFSRNMYKMDDYASL